MEIKHIIRRFRKEIRSRSDVNAHSTVILDDDPKRKENTEAAKLLLHDVFEDRITIKSGKGIICASREEAAILRIQEYTKDKKVSANMLLTSLPCDAIREYMKTKTGREVEVFIPDSAEAQFVDKLAKKYPEIRFAA